MSSSNRSATEPRRGIVALLDAHSPLLTLVVPLVIGSLLLGSSSNEMRSTVVTALVNLIIVVGLYIFVGNSGIISFGQVGFAAIGGYLSALLTMSPMTKAMLLPDLGGPLAEMQLSTTVATLIVAAVAAALAYLVAVPLMKLKGIAAAIATLSLLVIVQIVIQNWQAVSGGGGGTLTGIPVDADLETVLLWTVAACLAAWLYQRSRSGLWLRASREDDVAARSLGVKVERERRRAFALSAGVVAVAGSLYGHSVGSVSPGAFYLSLTFITLAMLVVGGIHSLSGALLGTVLVTGLTELFSQLESGGIAGLEFGVRPGMREMVLAALTALILMLRPQGLTAGREPRRISTWFRRKAPPPFSAVAATVPGATAPDDMAHEASR